MIKSWACALAVLCILTLRPVALAATDDTPMASLAGLLKLCREVGLPLPPKNAKLVRYESGGKVILDGVLQPQKYSLAILIESTGAQKEATFLSGTALPEDWKPRHWKVVDPAATAALETPGFDPDILFAVQCHALGWNELAVDILARCEIDRLDRQRRQVDHRGAYLQDKSDPPKRQIVSCAWYYWMSRMWKPMVDRKPILAMLKELRALDPELARMDDIRADLKIRALELALAPSTAKPGSVEALIDGLVEATQEGWPYENGPEPTPYQKLVRLGFEAVPVLIEHLDDARLTRGLRLGMNRGRSRDIRFKDILVKDFVSAILRKLAGSEAAHEWRTQSVDESGWRRPLVKADVLVWWLRAQKLGEESYLVKYATSPETEGGVQRTPQSPTQNQQEVIAQKYPRNLETIYRAILAKDPLTDSGSIVSAIESSKLPPNEKTRLLLIGASHTNLQHRGSSLWALKELDRQQFSAILTKTLDGFSGTRTAALWGCPEGAMADLVVEADEEIAWQALERLAKKANLELRLEILKRCGYSKPPSERRLKFLATFLDDQEVRVSAVNATRFGPYAFYQFPKMEVRNAAASVIGSILDFKNLPADEWQAKDWEVFREQVRIALRAKGVETPGG